MVSKYLTHKKNNQIVSEMMKMEMWLRASDRWKESKRVKTTRERESSDNGNGLLHDNTQNSTTTPASLPAICRSLPPSLFFPVFKYFPMFSHHFTFDLSFHNVFSWHWERKRTKWWREAMRTHKERSSLGKLPAHYALELRKYSNIFQQVYHTLWHQKCGTKWSFRNYCFQTGFSKI